MSDEFDLDLTNILEEEEEGTSYKTLPPEPRVNPNIYADTELSKQKVSKLEQELAQMRHMLEAGKKSNFLDKAFTKYSHLDDDFKNMLAEVIHGYSQASQAELKPLIDHIDNIQREVAITRKSIEDVNTNVNNFQSNLALDNLVLQYLQRGFKKNSVTRDHIDAAKKAHFARLEKDEAYYLKVDNVVNRQTLDSKTKDKLIGQIILDNFREEVAKKQAKGKTTEADPVLKKNVEKDPGVEKAQKKLDKEIEKEEEKEEPKELTQAEKDARREATLSRLNKLRGL